MVVIKTNQEQKTILEEKETLEIVEMNDAAVDHCKEEPKKEEIDENDDPPFPHSQYHESLWRLDKHRTEAHKRTRQSSFVSDAFIF